MKYKIKLMGSGIKTNSCINRLFEYQYTMSGMSISLFSLNMKAGHYLCVLYVLFIAAISFCQFCLLSHHCNDYSIVSNISITISIIPSITRGVGAGVRERCFCVARAYYINTNPNTIDIAIWKN